VRRSLALAATLIALVVSSTAAAATGRSSDTTLSLVAYSIPTAVFPKLTAAYSATPAGNGIKFTSTFAASEVQSKAVAAGLPADIVNLSISTDVDRLVSAGLVDKTWDANKYHGIVSKSVVVFVVRNGNPKHIKTWDDLVKPGVDVVFPNPFSSGGARWDVMAAYGSQLREKKTPKQAQAYLKSSSSTTSRRTRAAATRSTRFCPARVTSCSTTRAMRSSRSRRASRSTTSSRRRRSRSRRRLPS
jgi:ABC-type sulfate transport system, periplasmic component